MSVNITTYNRANLLERCISSVLQQSYPNIEIIVVDDFSADTTKDMMEKHYANEKRIFYIRHKYNKGNAAARNTALKKSKGKYVAFMDDDDEWIDCDKLKNQVSIFEKNKESNLGIVCSGVNIIDTQGKTVVKKEEMPANLIKTLLIGNGIIHNSTVMTTRDIMIKVGGFDEKMPRGVDSDFFRRVVVKHKYQVIIMPDITTAYYEHEGDRMTTNRNNAVSIAIQANVRVIYKHFFSFLTHPTALATRLYNRTKGLLRYYI